MKLNKAATARVKGGNMATVEQFPTAPFAKTKFYPLVMLIADMMDSIAEGQDVFMMIGATQKRDSFSLTVKLDGAGTTVYAVDLIDLAAQAETLL